MRSNADWIIIVAALALGGCSLGPEEGTPPAAAPPPVAQADLPPPGDAPAGAAYVAPPEVQTPIGSEPPPAPASRYDNVGYAAWSDETGTIAAAHRTLPPGSFAEVTSLDTGKTILVPITAVAQSGQEIELSGAAAQQLGLGQGARGGVRVRAVNPTPADLTALEAGQAPEARPNTPPVLLNPLRRKLAGMPVQPGRPVAAPAPKRPAVMPRPAPTPWPAVTPPRPAATNGASYYVQVAALSDPARARALARDLHGAIVAGGGLNRVRVGPYPNERAAQAARDGIARRGYGDARIVRPD